jgi:serine/threonine protein kinase
VIAGRYELGREIGRGGMGAVWLARDEVLGRVVAVKRIGMVPGTGTGSPDLDRAEREARLAARLNHPHVVAVFDLVTEGDERWLVMEYVEGTNLGELVRQEGPLPPDRAAALLGQVADALAAAHAAGIVHRDVKPSNMLVTADGQVKLSDFGIARAEADASLTQTGLVTGSPAYLAPEVAAGGQATAASDVWALGAALFHALAGRPPYEVGDNLMGALYKIVHEDPPRLADAGWLSPLLASSMTRDPGSRWSMEQVREFLRAGPSARAVPPPVATQTAPAPTSHDPAPTRTEVLADDVRAVAPDPAPASAGRRRSWGPAQVAGLVLLLAGVIVWAVLSGGEPAAREEAGNDPTRSPGATSPTDSAAQEPSEEEMEAFIADYLATAPSDPEAGFRMLTPQFQDQSGGLEGYRGFWDTVESAELRSVSADPGSLTVAYTVDYTTEDGRSVSDDVQLALVMAEGTYKIAGES